MAPGEYVFVALKFPLSMETHVKINVVVAFKKRYKKYVLVFIISKNKPHKHRLI